MWHGPALNKILNVISIILDLYWIWIVALVEFSHYHYDHSTSSFHFYRSSEYLYTWVRLSTIVIIIHTSGITRTTLDALQRDHIEFWFWRSAVRRLSLTAQEGPHVERSGFTNEPLPRRLASLPLVAVWFLELLSAQSRALVLCNRPHQMYLIPEWPEYVSNFVYKQTGFPVSHHMSERGELWKFALCASRKFHDRRFSPERSVRLWNCLVLRLRDFNKSPVQVSLDKFWVCLVRKLRFQQIMCHRKSCSGSSVVHDLSWWEA